MDKQLLEQEAEKSALEANYIKSDKEVFETTHWCEFNDYVKGYIAGATSSSTVKELEREVERLNGLLENAVTREYSEVRQTIKNKKEVWENFKTKNNIK